MSRPRLTARQPPPRTVGQPTDRPGEYIVGRADDLAPGEHRIVEIGRLSLGVFRIGDAYYAIPNLCPHQYGPLCEGRLSGAIIATAQTNWEPVWAYDGEVVACPWHGLEVHVPTGRCLAYPEVRLRHYPVRREGDVLIVSLRRTSAPRGENAP